MNKKRIEELIPKAYEALKNAGIAKLNEDTKLTEISKTFRGYISSFGAAIAMGSLKAAIAFYSKQEGALKSRDTLIKIIYVLINDNSNVTDFNNIPQTALYDYVDKAPNESEVKEEIYNAAIALKLAMNLYKIV